jgi:hypothetical protein
MPLRQQKYKKHIHGCLQKHAYANKKALRFKNVITSKNTFVRSSLPWEGIRFLFNGDKISFETLLSFAFVGKGL